MSRIFNVRCELCEVDGPKLRRSAGGAWLQEDATAEDEWPRLEDGSLMPAPSWFRFLIDHEYHELVLKHE